MNFVNQEVLDSNFEDYPPANVSSQIGFLSCISPIILCAFRKIKVCFLLLFLSGKVDITGNIHSASKSNVFPNAADNDSRIVWQLELPTFF